MYYTGDFIQYKKRRYLCLEQTIYLPDKQRDKWKQTKSKEFSYVNEHGTRFIVKPKKIKEKL